MSKECKTCKYSEIIRVGHLEIDVPDCNKAVPDWLKCRMNDLCYYEPKEDKE